MNHPQNGVLVLGGGAAGFFAAIACAEQQPRVPVVLWEKTTKLLSKVKVSGGGRCNVTHACHHLPDLLAHYPRGNKALKPVLSQFMPADTVAWFERRGVRLKTEPDGRMFPITDDSQTIVDCLMKSAQKAGVQVVTKQEAIGIRPLENGRWEVTSDQRERHIFRAVIVATGGSPKAEGLEWLARLGHQIEPPVPSLFTFNMPQEPIRTLMGVSVSQAKARVAGTKLEASGPLLITHWGMSGPAILKLSAWGARILAEKNYTFQTLVNWVPDTPEASVRQQLEALKAQGSGRKCTNRNPFGLPQRLWDFLLEKTQIHPDQTWRELPNKSINRLVNTLVNDEYAVMGKTTFKEEFVTCGGVSLQSVEMKSMKSNTSPGLFFAGEVLDIDGITGGFNFQAAWATGFVAGHQAAMYCQTPIDQ